MVLIVQSKKLVKMLTTSEKAVLVPESSQSSFYLFPKKKLKIFLVMVVAAVLFYFYNQPMNLIEFDEMPEEIVAENKTFNLLFWKHFFSHHDWYAEEDGTVGEATLKSVECPVTNCYFTHDHNYLPDITEFDAIMFHVPEPSDPKYIPKNRTHKQLYIMVSLE